MTTEAFYKRLKRSAALVRNNINVQKRAMEIHVEHQYLSSNFPLPLWEAASDLRGKSVPPEVREKVENLLGGPVVCHLSASNARVYADLTSSVCVFLSMQGSLQRKARISTECGWVGRGALVYFAESTYVVEDVYIVDNSTRKPLSF